MYFLYFYHVCFYSFMCSYHVPFICLCMTSIYSFHLFINNLRIYYLLYYSFICIYYLLMYSLFCIHYSFIQYLLFKYVFVYVFTIHSNIHLYIFYYSFISILIFTYTYFTIHFCCDAPKPGGPLTTRQPAEYKWRSGYPTSL